MSIHRDEIRAVWNWLPAFRIVAETEHLPTAAKRAHLTAAALSRTVRLLEDELGRELFHRRGRGLHLNDNGKELLRAVRRSMRIVHDAHRTLADRTHQGPLRLAAGGVSRVFALRAVEAVRQDHPGLEPWLLTPRPVDVLQQLQQGDLDLALGSFVLRAPDIETELLTYATSSVYCGPSHPLWGLEEVELAAVQEHPFVAPPPDANGAAIDGWPPELERRTAMVVDRLETGLEVCKQAPLLAVLPDALAQRAGGLHALPLPSLIPKTPVVAMFRKPTGEEGPVATVLEALRTTVAT